MEFEQIIKRLDFLEKQQRVNKDAIAIFSERLDAMEASVNAVSKQVKAVAGQVGDITPITKRIDQFENLIAKQRAELLKMIEENDKTHTKAETEIAKRFPPEILELQKAIAQLKTTTTASLTEFKKILKERGDEIQRMTTNVNDFKTRVEEARRSNEDVIGALKAMDEARKNDLKRIADLQGEIAAVRKRVDENRDKYTIVADSARNIENRFNDLLASEQERKQAQLVFIEQQTLAQISREHAWKDWDAKFAAFQKETSGIDEHIQALDEALRGAKRAQETYLELNTKLERRINEVTEMQRLTEDRLRQEWISFKTDEQKRWTGYNLNSEENFRDIRKEMQKIAEGIPPLNDATQVLQDQIHQITDASEKQLQEMMNAVYEWMSAYQRIMGHGKKAKK
jgi:chromosome segregation ATPase